MALGRKPIEIVKEGKHQLLAKAEHWERIFLSEVAKVQNGYAFSSANFSKSEGLPLIRIRDIDSATTVDRYKGVFPKEYLVQNGDILVGMDGDFKAAKWKGEQALLNQRVCRIIPNSKLFDEKFLFLCLQPFLDAIHAETSAVTVKHLSSKTIEEFPLPFPNLKEQQQIVSKIEELFSVLDKGVEELKTAQQQLKVYRQAVLKWAFEGRLTNENVKDGELPEGWNLKRLNEICKIIGGVTKGRDFKGKATIHLPYLRVANVQDGYLNLKQIKTIEVLLIDKEKYRLNYGDILYTEGGDKDKLGRGTIWKNEVEDCIHQNHVFRARPLSIDYNSKFIAYFSQTKAAKSYFFKHGKQTTNLASINLTVLSNLPIPMPSFEEQLQIIQEIEGRLSVCDKIEETITHSLQQAKALRQSILKKAFEGRL
jgi:type I restriction enzyme, S subunit